MLLTLAFRKSCIIPSTSRFDKEIAMNTLFGQVKLFQIKSVSATMQCWLLAEIEKIRATLHGVSHGHAFGMKTILSVITFGLLAITSPWIPSSSAGAAEPMAASGMGSPAGVQAKAGAPWPKTTFVKPKYTRQQISSDINLEKAVDLSEQTNLQIWLIGETTNSSIDANKVEFSIQMYSFEKRTPIKALTITIGVGEKLIDIPLSRFFKGKKPEGVVTGLMIRASRWYFRDQHSSFVPPWEISFSVRFLNSNNSGG
jgi:hypothetical protein